MGSFFHLAGELFNQINGVKLTHVPYRGSVAAFTDLIGGHIQVNFTQLSQAVAYRDNKDLKVLAVLEEMLFSRWPEYPSITERTAGLQACRRPGTASSARPGCRAPVVARLNAELIKALNIPEVKSKLEDNGYRVVGGRGGRVRQAHPRRHRVLRANLQIRGRRGAVAELAAGAQAR